MPPIQGHQDHCKTADDVMAAARAVVERRRKFTAPPVVYGLPKPTPSVAERKKIPVPIVPADIASATFPSIGCDAVAHFYGPPIMEPTRHTIKNIQLAVCHVSGISLAEMTSPRRMSYLIPARQVAMLLCKRLTLRSLPEIGRRFGGRDHTTVLHALRKLEPVLVEIEPKIASDAPLLDLARAAMESFRRIQPKSQRFAKSA